jgi:hypothetical protein
MEFDIKVHLLLNWAVTSTKKARHGLFMVPFRDLRITRKVLNRYLLAVYQQGGIYL